MSSRFYQHFKENMNELGLDAPEALYGNLTLATSTLSALIAYMDKFGTKVLVKDLIGAGTKLEILQTVGALTAAYYVGAVIGSLAVATGKTASGGTSIADVMIYVQENNIHRDWMRPFLTRWNGLFDKSAPARSHIKHQAVAP